MGIETLACDRTGPFAVLGTPVLQSNSIRFPAGYAIPPDQLLTSSIRGQSLHSGQILIEFNVTVAAAAEDL